MNKPSENNISDISFSKKNRKLEKFVQKDMFSKWIIITKIIPWLNNIV